MLDQVVVDVEIQRPIESLTGGWDSTDEMGVGCAVVYEERTDRFRIFGPDQVEALKVRLLAADEVAGFNTHRFDFNVIWGLPRTARVEDFAPALAGHSNDLLRRIWQALRLDPDHFERATHGGWSLNAVVKGTLGRDLAKIADGAQAPRWFQAGDFARLHTYCLDDVTLERDLLRFVRRHGYVLNGHTGQRVELGA